MLIQTNTHLKLIKGSQIVGWHWQCINQEGYWNMRAPAVNGKVWSDMLWSHLTISGIFDPLLKYDLSRSEIGLCLGEDRIWIFRYPCWVGNEPTQKQKALYALFSTSKRQTCSHALRHICWDSGFWGWVKLQTAGEKICLNGPNEFRRYNRV